MKVAVVLAFLAAVANAGSFSAEDQAIWIDRHNYFRTTGLPWAAGDMRRIGWSDDLASSAESAAAQCSGASAAGVNVFQSSASNSSSIIDEAIQQWVVETSMTTLKTLPQPGTVGVAVGTGVYNSYSQVLWASTTSVGCATASCSGGDMVVCEYSPAGNDPSSPWYVHGETASDCPSGTTASQGLCIVEGDAANNQIATIPAGRLTYEVYPAYVANMQTLLIETARAIASGSTSATQSAPAATTAAPTDSATQTATTPAPATSSNSQASSTSEDSAATKTGSTQTTTTSSAYSSLESGSGSEPSAATKSGKTTTSSSTTDSSSETSTATESGKTTASSSTTDSSSDTSKATKRGKSTTTTSSSTTDSSEKDAATKQTSQTSSSELSSSDESAPGTVKASSDTGSTFTNQAPSTTTESSTKQSSTASSTEQTASSTTTAPSTASAESASSITNKSSTSGGGGISAAGLAGMIVLAVVGVAAFGVVMSYKRNQQRQREIMRDGGIRII